MITTTRQNTFETNSSSIHCLTVAKSAEIDHKLFTLTCKIYPYNEDEICAPEEFCTFTGKLRYLWTLRCKGQEYYVESEKIDEFTSMLKSIVPNCVLFSSDSKYLPNFLSYLIGDFGVAVQADNKTVDTNKHTIKREYFFITKASLIRIA